MGTSRKGDQDVGFSWKKKKTGKMFATPVETPGERKRKYVKRMCKTSTTAMQSSVDRALAEHPTCNVKPGEQSITLQLSFIKTSHPRGFQPKWRLPNTRLYVDARERDEGESENV